MSSAKLITIFGATGAQGGSVVNSLLQNKSNDFTIRGISRNLSSENAKNLTSQGVEMVQADGLKRDEILSAFRGSWGVFVNTNSADAVIEAPDGPSEVDLGKIIIDAAVEAGVQHFVYSGMESAAAITDGAIPCKAFDEKHAIGEYARAQNFKTVNIVSPGWYMENHLSKDLAPIFGGFPFFADEAGYITCHCPRWGGNGEIPFIAVEGDYGDLVHGVFLNPEKYNGKLIQGVSQSATPEYLAETFQKVTQKKSRFVALENWKDMETYEMPSLETVKGMFGFCQYSGGLYYGVPNSLDAPSELKKAAVKAQGRDESDGQLMTLEKFFATSPVFV